MAKFIRSKRENLKNLLVKITIIGGLFFILILLVIGNLNIGAKRKVLDLKTEELKKKLEKLSLEEQNLNSEIYQAQTKEHIEKIAREKFNLQKKGEKAVAFPSLQNEENKQAESQGKKSFFQKLFGWFRGR